jgi:hypothetical protein
MLGLLLNSNFVACVLATRNFVDSGLTFARIQEELNSIKPGTQLARGLRRGGLRLVQSSTERARKDKEMTIFPANKRFLMKCKEWLHTEALMLF